MWGRKLDTWQKYFLFAATGICCILYFTYQEFTLALEKQNKEHEIRMKRLSRDILTPSQLRSLLKDRLENEINEHRYKGEFERGRIKRNVPNYDKLHPIDKKILEFMDVVEHHNQKRNYLRDVIKREITDSIEAVISQKLPRSSAIKHVSSTVDSLFARFTSTPRTPERASRIVLPWDKFARDRGKGDTPYKSRVKTKGGPRKPLRRPKKGENVERRRRIYERAIHEELTDEAINAPGFQLSDDFLMSGPSKDLFITHKWKTWLIFTAIQIAIYLTCVLAGILNSYCAILTRVLNTISYSRCLCKRCLLCKPRNASRCLDEDDEAIGTVGCVDGGDGVSWIGVELKSEKNISITE